MCCLYFALNKYIIIDIDLKDPKYRCNKYIESFMSLIILDIILCTIEMQNNFMAYSCKLYILFVRKSEQFYLFLSN